MHSNTADDKPKRILLSRSGDKDTAIQVATRPAPTWTKRTNPAKPTSTWRLWLPAWLLVAAVSTASAQTLARPGWNASGFNADPWWKRAVFYEVTGGTVASSASGSVVTPQTAATVDFKTITANLDAAKSLGIDALILPVPQSPLPDATLDSFDELMRQASSRGVHILLTLPAESATADLSATARFWLSRGVSGFHVVTPPQTSPQDNSAIVQALRRITSSAVGGRIVITDSEIVANSYSAIPASPRRTRHAHTASAMRVEDFGGAQLQIDSHRTLPQLPDASRLRALLTQSQLGANVILDLQPPTPMPGLGDAYPSLANAMAAIALTMRPAALIQTGQDLSLQSTNSALAAWYRQLTTLHHSSATLRSGSVSMLDFDAQNALVWVIRPASNARLAAPMVVACNLSSSPLRLSLVTALRELNLHGFYLRTLLRTDKAMGAQDIDAVTLPPFGVYIGELHR